MLISILMIIVGFILLIKGADFLVDGASGVAKKFKIPEMIIGLTIVAMGTSMPELMVSLSSALEGHSDISLGNVIGSNLANILLILGICAWMKKINIPKATRRIENPLSLIITIILFALCLNGGSVKNISQSEGIFLLLLFVAFLIYLFVNAKKSKENESVEVISKVNENKEDIKNNSHSENKEQEKEVLDNDKIVLSRNTIRTFILDIIKIGVGIFGLKYGADFVVDHAVNVATIMGISEKIIGVTIIAVGTSLPELVASVTAVMKGENNMAVGNIVGSNIFNILLILGVSSSICPINYSESYNFDMIYLITASALLAIFPYVGKSTRALDRAEGIIFFLMYVGYITTLIFLR